MQGLTMMSATQRLTLPNHNRQLTMYALPMHIDIGRVYRSNNISASQQALVHAI